MKLGWGSGIFFSKSPMVGRFLIFYAKIQILSRLVLFLSNKNDIFLKFLKKHSLARSVPKPLMGEAGGHQ